MISPSAMAEAMNRYPNSRGARRAFYIGAHQCWRGHLHKVSPYAPGSTADKAWLAGFEWAFDVNSVTIGEPKDARA